MNVSDQREPYLMPILDALAKAIEGVDEASRMMIGVGVLEEYDAFYDDCEFSMTEDHEIDKALMLTKQAKRELRQAWSKLSNLRYKEEE